MQVIFEQVWMAEAYLSDKFCTWALFCTQVLLSPLPTFLAYTQLNGLANTGDLVTICGAFVDTLEFISENLKMAQSHHWCHVRVTFRTRPTEVQSDHTSQASWALSASMPEVLGARQQLYKSIRLFYLLQKHRQ